MKPILAITMGDPAGIGPEITVRALNRKETYEKCRPVVTGDPRVDELRYAVTDILASIDERITMHDFRVVFGPSHTNLIFDIVLPFDYPTSEEDVVSDIESRVKSKLGPTHFTVIQVDRTAVK